MRCETEKSRGTGWAETLEKGFDEEKEKRQSYCGQADRPEAALQHSMGTLGLSCQRRKPAVKSWDREQRKTQSPCLLLTYFLIWSQSFKLSQGNLHSLMYSPCKGHILQKLLHYMEPISCHRTWLCTMPTMIQREELQKEPYHSVCPLQGSFWVGFISVAPEQVLGNVSSKMN